mgnify:CR=1 FL=1
MKIENRTELKEYRTECQKRQRAKCRVLICGGTGCLAGVQINLPENAGTDKE